LQPLTERNDNNFGMLRLLFAVLVAFTHSFRFVDGNLNREPLIGAFHLFSFGDLAVDGFFLISGYLVTKSLLQSQSNAEYLGKRILRIYPGFVVALGMSLLVGLIAGGILPTFNTQTIISVFANVFFFRGVYLANAFAKVPCPGINGSIWSIAYEFRCYLALIAFDYIGLFRRRYLAGGAALLFLITSCLLPPNPGQSAADWFLGNSSSDARFFGLFLTGSVFYVFRDVIQFKQGYALSCFIAMLALLQSRTFATPAVAILGGYSIFWFAFQGPGGRLSKILNKTDLSYGFYLYAWPIGNLIVLFHRSVSVWSLFLYTTVISAAVAYLSWIAIEKPALKLKRYLTPSHGFHHSRKPISTRGKSVPASTRVVEQGAATTWDSSWKDKGQGDLGSPANEF